MEISLLLLQQQKVVPHHFLSFFLGKERGEERAESKSRALPHTYIHARIHVYIFIGNKKVIVLVQRGRRGGRGKGLAVEMTLLLSPPGPYALLV